MNLVYQQRLNRVNSDVFRTLIILPGKLYTGKILEKIPDVPMTKTYRSSHLTLNFVS